MSNTTIANNSFNGTWNPDDLGSNQAPANFKVIGNIGVMDYSGYCPAAMRAAGDFQYNTWQNSSCGSTDANLNGAPLPYVNTHNDATMNYTLTGGVAQDFVPMSVDSLTTDIAGNARPDGGSTKLDAGASEIP
jgi:hypothetical protein